MTDLGNGDIELSNFNENDHPMSNQTHDNYKTSEEIGPDGLPITESKQETIDINVEEGEQPPEETKKISLFAAIMQLLNSVLGIGILSVPNSFINSGYVASLILLVIMALLSYCATKIVLDLSTETGVCGFDELALRLLGKVGSMALSILNIIFLVVGLLSFLIIGTDMLSSWFELAGVNVKSMWIRALVVAVYALLIPIALSIPRRITFLQYFSMLNVACIFFFVIVLFIKMCIIVSANGIHTTVTPWKLDLSIFQTLSIYGVTFSMPCVILPIMRIFDNDIKRRRLVGLIAIIVCFALITITGLSGYFSFGNTADPNILNSFGNDDIIIVIVRVLFFIVVTFAYPVLIQAVLASWSQLIFKNNNAADLQTWKRAVVLVLANGIPLIIAMFLSNVKPALGVGGALGGCIVNFMFPGVLKVAASDKAWQWKNTGYILLAVFGIAAGIISTYQAVLDAIASFS